MVVKYLTYSFKPEICSRRTNASLLVNVQYSTVMGVANSRPWKGQSVGRDRVMQGRAASTIVEQSFTYIGVMEQKYKGWEYCNEKRRAASAKGRGVCSMEES